MRLVPLIADWLNGFPPAGSIYTNVPDMAQFIMLQFRTGPVGGNQILASTRIQEMFQPVAPTQGHGSVGIGWFIAPLRREIYGHLQERR